MLDYTNWDNNKIYTVSEPTEKLLEVIKEGLQNIKAKEIRVLNLENIETAVCKYFVICSGTSRTHVSSIAHSVEKDIKETLQEFPWKKEGFTNGEWVLLDYSSIVVHVFQEQTREFYNLEGLWADAEVEIIEEN